MTGPEPIAGGSDDPGGPTLDAATRARLLFEQARDIVLFVRPDGAIIDANPAAVAAYGYQRADLLRLRVQDLRDPDDAAALPDQLRRAVAEGVVFETRHRRCDGSTFPVEVGSHPVDIGGGNAHAQGPGASVGGTRLLMSVVRDLTERRRVEAALRFIDAAGETLAESLNHDETLRRVARLAVPILADYCVVDVRRSDGRTERVAWSHVDPDGQRLLDAGVAHFAPTAERRVHPVAQAIETGEPTLAPEVDDAWLRRAAISPDHLAFMRALELRSFLTVPLVARGRSIGALTCCFTAKSARRHTGEDLALARHLAQRAALAVDNARLYRAAQEELAERKRLEVERLAFADAVAHDLKTPLSVVRGQAQLLQRRLRRGLALDAAALAASVGGIEGAADRAVGLIDDLLDAARLRAAGPLELRRAPVDLVALVRAVAAEQGRASDRHAIRVVATSDSLVGEWDGPRLQRVLTNLFGNAVKYSPDGGRIVVRVGRVGATDGGTDHAPEDDAAESTVRAGDRANGWAEVAVTDRGVGIPAADLSRIFDRFHRGANTAGRFTGMGIGLSGARQIVELHGGTIAVDSAEGEGSTFTVRLPLVDETPVAIGDGRG